MLLIKRAPGEPITVGDEIGIRVVSIRGNCVTLDITAPTSAVVVQKDRAPSEQSVCVGDDVEIVMVGVCGQYVKVGIIAPRSMFVRRGSTQESIPSGDNVHNLLMELQGPLEPAFGGTGYGPR
jgi:sRNA-binding carbon storage regulator CsrA